MRPLSFFLLALVVLLQYKLWFTNGGILTAWHTKQALVKLNEENMKMQQKNSALAADVEDLKQGNEAIEDRARMELGLIKKNEIFYQIVK